MATIRRGTASTRNLEIAAIKAVTSVSAVVGRYLKLVKDGHEFKACCPFHADRTPSFTVNDEKKFYHCFGCEAHGDVLDFVRAVERVGLCQAVEIVRNDLPVVMKPPAQAHWEKGCDTEAAALRIWRLAEPVQGTPAETYLRARGITCPLPGSLRFSRLPYGKRGRPRPCLVALVASADNRARGIQRTYLAEDGSRKADVPKPKLALGRIRGGAIRLAPAATELVVCEGLEDGLTLQQELGRTVWVAAGAGNLATMQLPQGIRSLTIGADCDPTGERAAQAAARRLAQSGMEVRIIRPVEGCKDFNDQLQAKGE